MDVLWTRPLWNFFSWAGWRESRRDWSGGGYTLDWLQLNLSISKFLSSVMRYKKRNAFSPPQGCLLELHCSNGELNRQLSTFQVFRSQETAHSTITNFMELVFSPVETPMLMTFTLDNWCCANQSGPFRCVSSSVFIAGSSYTGSKEGLWYHDQ